MAPGTIVDYEDAFLPYIDDLLAGRGIDPVISNDEWGYLLTVYTPAHDSNGKCQCYVAVDVSMQTIWKYVSDVETVFKRADTAMYGDKVAMKAQRRE